MGRTSIRRGCSNKQTLCGIGLKSNERPCMAPTKGLPAALVFKKRQPKPCQKTGDCWQTDACPSYSTICQAAHGSRLDPPLLEAAPHYTLAARAAGRS